MAISERDRLRADFVRRAGWGDAGERLLAGDASFRKYFRLTRPRASAVVMDAPAPQEDVRPFVRIGRHLSALGLSAPAIHAIDEDNGFLLLIPGAMEAGLADWFFWGSLAAALAVAFVVTVPVNHWMIRRGRGHAAVHQMHEAQHHH